MDINHFDTRFLGSFPKVEDCPQSQLPEYAFIGRSNVGKSSLINALLNKKNLTKVSGIPGKTRYLNLFEINEQWIIADLPGYGYAKTSKKIRENFPTMIKNYLLSRKNLFNTYLLIDIKLPPQKNDLSFMIWMGENEIPFSIIFTKCDKISLSVRNKNIANYNNKLNLYWQALPETFFSSSVSKQGCDEVINKIFAYNKLAVIKI